ncbi:MAG: hypothetical protein PWR22_580 [Moorella sp. (in: firmicutes)]|jgi:hypothetical protein|nr:hypothetical protein [Moorella sp. (in: firmicutes)]MDK2894932.1 hypothetical protein [Moorella sp. (in: firmicutes)]
MYARDSIEPHDVDPHAGWKEGAGITAPSNSIFRWVEAHL